MYLQALAGHDNIVRLRHVIKGNNGQDIYLTFDHMHTDLLATIRADVLRPVHVKYVTYQILRALKYVHSAGVTHRDIKPSNILINEDCHVKVLFLVIPCWSILPQVCDFGLARSVVFETETRNPQHTDYVSTRWYRAIEVLLGSTRYTEAADLWGLGCVYGEMLLRRPVFPGVSALDQIVKILELLGKPSAADVTAMGSAYAPTLLDMLPPLCPLSFARAFPDATTEATNFLGLCLALNPTKRCTADEALHHPFVADFHDPDDEPVYSDGPIRLDLDDYQVYSVDDYRTAIYETIFKRKVEARKLELKLMTNPGKVALMDHEDTLPEPF